jgi:hypothetical protein
MSVIGLLLVQVAALAGLAVGRRLALLPLVAAITPAAVLGGAEAGALAALAAAGFALGTRLHELVAEQYAR